MYKPESGWDVIDILKSGTHDKHVPFFFLFFFFFQYVMSFGVDQIVQVGATIIIFYRFACTHGTT